MLKREKVSELALVKCINRVLAPDLHKLCKSRPADVPSQGAYYLLGVNRNTLVNSNISLEDYGRDKGALKDLEELALEA